MRSKLTELTEAVKELKQGLHPSGAENVVPGLSADPQIKQMKQAIGALAYAVTEEIESMRKSFMGELEHRWNQLNYKVD